MKPFYLSAPFAAALGAAFGLSTRPAGAQAQTPPSPPPATQPPAPASPVPVRPARPAPEPYPEGEKPDFPGAQWEPASPFNFQKYDRPTGEHPINCIVIHDIEGSAISAVRWFQNPIARVTSHYVIASNGTVYQQVKERDVAWHAGNGDINRRSVGIEHDGFAYRPGFYNGAEYEASARLVRSIALRYQIPRDRAHIFGHAEVPNAADPTKFGGSSGHTDPGPYWDWDYFMALVRNDAAAAVVPAANNAAAVAPTVSVQLHPGEKGEAVFTLTNTGDDVWPADTKPPRPNPELRQSGPVYLGPANAAGPAAAAAISVFAPGWISPHFAASPDSGDVPPGQTARFVVPLTGSRTVGTQADALRLWKVFPAPHPPVPFGPNVSLAVSTVPWDIVVPLPQTPPIGWSEKTLPNGSRVFWRNVRSVNTFPAPISWTTPLPLSGNWDVYVRVLPTSQAPKPPRYEFDTTTSDNRLITATWNGQPAQTDQNGWHKLGRFPFDVPPQEAAPRPLSGVRPGAPTPAAPPLMGTVKLSPNSSQSGVLVAGEVRFVGPFP